MQALTCVLCVIVITVKSVKKYDMEHLNPFITTSFQ